MQPLVPLVFHYLSSLYPPSFRHVLPIFSCDECTLTCNYCFHLHNWPSVLIYTPSFPCSHIFFVMQHAGIELGPHRYNAILLTSMLCYTRSHKPRIVQTFVTRACAGEVGVAHYPKWRRSLLIRAETRDFLSKREMGEERSLGDDAHLRPS